MYRGVIRSTPVAYNVFLRASLKPGCIIRRRASQYSFVLLGLGLLVFAWGLQYKVSQYAQPNATAHHMVQAKLLNEDTAASATEAHGLSGPSPSTPAQHPSASGMFWVVLTSAILSGAVSLEAREWQHGEDPWRVCCAGGPSALFSRPPPPPLL